MRSTKSTPRLEAIEAIYAAALDPGMWPQALQKMNADLRIKSSFIAVKEKTGDQTSLSISHGIDVALLEKIYFSHYVALDPGLPVMQEQPAGFVVNGSGLMSASAWKKSEFYNDCLTQFDDIYYCGGGVVANSPFRIAYAAIQRPYRSGAYTHRDMARLQSYFPHLTRAFQISRQLGAAQAERQALGRLFGEVAGAVLLLDAGGAVTFMNRQAEELIRSNDGLILKNGLPEARSWAETGRLRTLINAALATGLGRSAGAGGAVELSRAGGKAPLQVLVTPVPASAAEVRFGTRVCAALFIPQPHASAIVSPETAAAPFGLTSAEWRVARWIAEGLSVKEIAERAGTSAATVRNQLKTVFGKLGVHRQAELVRLLLASPAARAGGPPPH